MLCFQCTDFMNVKPLKIGGKLDVLFCAVKYLAFLRKRMNTNPSRGPYHFRAPSRIFWRTVRGEVVFFFGLSQTLCSGYTSNNDEHHYPESEPSLMIPNYGSDYWVWLSLIVCDQFHPFNRWVDWMLTFFLTGMLPHKTKRGQAALDRLKVFDGIPPLMTRWIILTVSHFTDKYCRWWLPSALFDYQLRTYTIKNWDIFASGVRIWPFSCGFSSAFVFHRESVWSSQLLSRLCVWSPHAEWVFLWNCLQYM